MLRSKSVKAPPSVEDGLRISVMSRHTLPDGTTPDPDITQESYDEWWSELAPPPGLVGAHYRKEVSWPQFENDYKIHLETSYEAGNRLGELSALALGTTVTVMCVENTPERCHRRLLIETCRLILPEIEVVVQ